MSSGTPLPLFALLHVRQSEDDKGLRVKRAGMDPETDAIVQSQAGNASAFRLVVDQYGPVLYRAAVMMTRDPAAAEDAVQDTFVKAWNAIGSFKAGTNLRAWLVRILVNHLNGQRRKKALSLTRLIPGLTERPARDTPESLYLESEASQEVFALLNALRRNERTVVILHYYMDMSLAEVSEATGWRPGTVRSRLSRALGKLREQLDVKPHELRETSRRASRDGA